MEYKVFKTNNMAYYLAIQDYDFFKFTKTIRNFLQCIKLIFAEVSLTSITKD